jgi:hypothetical protein
MLRARQQFPIASKSYPAGGASVHRPLKSLYNSWRDICIVLSVAATRQAVMQIGSSSPAYFPSAAYAAPRQVAPPPNTDVVNRADMPKSADEQAARGVGFLDTMLLTQKDIALIEKVTGIKIDYDTGRSTPAEGSPQNKVDFVRALVDMRYEEFARATPPKELDPGSLRDVFKNSATNGKTIDPSFLSEALKWFDDPGTSSSASKTQGRQVDQYT